MKYRYDLHIHSCLSPCGEDTMTPATVAGMAKLNGTDMIALTDHNTSRNCPAFRTACEFYGLIPLFGMELTAAEDVHLICLFDNLEDALAFNDWVDERRMRYKNKPDIFGRQLIMNEDDEVIGEEDDLLINATSVSIDEAYEKVTEMGGACYPAHIDRDANGIVAMLGAFPTEPHFSAYELNDADDRVQMIEQYPHIADLAYLVCSDAHYVRDIPENANSIDLPDDIPPASAMIRMLRGEGRDK